MRAIFGVVSLGVMLVLVMLNSQSSFATNGNGELNGKTEINLAKMGVDEVKWQMIFLSSYSGCSNYHYQMLNQYNMITEDYMKMYNLDNSEYKPQCIPDSKYSNYKAPKDLDLLILVYDRNLGRKELNANDIGGLYNHVGTDKTKNNVIIFCDCPNFKFSEPVWILTHELSHFILYYKGYGPDIAENMIHTLDARHDYCVEAHEGTSCSTTDTKTVDNRLHYSFTVMAPYIPAINAAKIPSSVSVSDSPELVEMQRQVTKWWISGKITEQEYLDSLSLLVKENVTPNAQSSYSYFETSKIIFTDPPKEKKTDVNNHELPSAWSDDKIRTILKRSPFINLSDSDNPLQIKDRKEIPQWFKTRAQLWTDQEIGNYEFLSGVQYFFSEEK